MLLSAALAIIIIFATLLVIPVTVDTRAFACSCAGPRPASEVYQNSDAVFVGKAIDIQSEGFLSTVRFTVEMAWKGVSDDNIILKTASSGAACGYGFEEGRDYLVYAYGSPESLETGLCGRTQPFAEAYADLAYLGPGYVPTPGEPIVEREPAGPLLTVLATGVAVAGTIVFVALRKYRH